MVGNGLKSATVSGKLSLVVVTQRTQIFCRVVQRPSQLDFHCQSPSLKETPELPQLSAEPGFYEAREAEVSLASNHDLHTNYNTTSPLIY